MKCSRTLAGLVGMLLCYPLQSAAEISTPQSLSSSIQNILATSQQPLHLGMIVRNVKTGKVLFQKEADSLFTPASTQKLFTAIAALAYLGPDFRFQTQLLTTGTVKNDTVEGDLYVKFSGDPELSSKNLDGLIQKLSDQGIKKVTGHIYLDTATYGAIPYGPGWMWDDLSYGYAAPLKTLILDHNHFALHLTPSKTIGQPPTLSANLPQGVVRFVNRARSIPNYNKACPLTIYSTNDNQYTLGGCINQAWGKQCRALAIRNPLVYVKQQVSASLHRHHISFSGNLYVHKIKARTTPLAEHDSPPLEKIVFNMLKESDNLTADSLLKKLGQRYYQQPGTWQNGLRAMKLILKDTGINFEKNHITDGAGLSRYNLLSPNQFAKLLRYAYNNKKVHTPLIHALPIAGTDGTLIERMLRGKNNANIHAKTGSMSGVASLAGYIHNERLGDLSFAIMINDFAGKAKPYLHLEDQLCQLLANYKPARSHG